MPDRQFALRHVGGMWRHGRAQGESRLVVALAIGRVLLRPEAATPTPEGSAGHQPTAANADSPGDARPSQTRPAGSPSRGSRPDARTSSDRPYGKHKGGER